MLQIYISRHGQNEDNATGILNGHRNLPLTDIGIRQAYELAEGIKTMNHTFDAVYTSPLVRASKTAEIICETLEIAKPKIMELLIERNFGVMSGKLAKDIEKLCKPHIVKTETITYFLSPEGAETFPDLFERARLTLDEIYTLHTDGSILLSTHGDFGKMLYGAFYGIHWQEMLTKFHFDNCELLVLSPEANHNQPHVIKIEQYNH